jgi:hypothetical protein
MCYMYATSRKFLKTSFELIPKVRVSILLGLAEQGVELLTKRPGLATGRLHLTLGLRLLHLAGCSLAGCSLTFGRGSSGRLIRVRGEVE